jgi:hypothetical protein
VIDPVTQFWGSFRLAGDPLAMRQVTMLCMQFKRLPGLTLPCVILVGACSVHADAQTEKCDALPHVTVPEQDLPAADETKAGCDALSHNRGAQLRCDGLSLYYSNFPGHIDIARSFALSELRLFGKKGAPAAPSAAETSIDGADALTLAMIYANGEGVTRNLPLARQFVCQDGDGVAIAPTDELLQQFEDAVKKDGRFDACQDGGGGFGRSFNYQCLGLQGEQALEEIPKREESILAGSSPELKASFKKLAAAYNDFQDAYSVLKATECEGGTGCGPISENADLTIERTWLAALSAVQAGSPPCSTASAATFAQLDSDLNKQYKDELRDSYTDTSDESKAFASLVRAADRAWLKYRDAWVSYGHLRWPAVPADQWRAWQTKEWIDLLALD